jgi:hypothetical protein
MASMRPLGLVLETVAERYTDDIMARFARSPEGSAVLKECNRFGWAALIIDLGMRHPEEAPETVKELRAFWRFVQREFEPLFAEDCLKLLERSDLASALRRKPAKSAPA